MDFTDTATRVDDADEVVPRSGETVDRIAARLKRGIFEGRYAPGQRLIARDVGEQLTVSRNSLREAFRALEADGLVHVVPNRGAVVRSISAAEVRQIFQVREAVEGFAARTAAQNIDQGDHRATLKAVIAVGRVHQAQSLFVEFVEDNRIFHQRLVTMSGNPLLSELVDKHQLPVFMLRLRQILSMERVIGNALDEHDAIADAVFRGDANTAYDAMRHHLWHSAEQILNLPDQV